MDPNQTLKEIREIVNDFRDDHILRYAGYSEDQRAELGDLIERIAALDQWLTKGGFLPKDWRAER